jgi:YfiH family protein
VTNFITHPLLIRSRIAHGFFTREGGVGIGAFASLNCHPGVGDDPEAVAENRRRITKALGAETILTARQEHTPRCLYVDRPWSGEPSVADALVTDVPGLALGILTADCAPVLLYGETSEGKPIIGAAHAGWRGALGGVTDATVAAMRGRGAARIVAVVGPCIAQESYEVSPGFEVPFLKENPASAAHFSGGRFDLPACVRERLRLAGVDDAAMTGHDTCADETRFFSHRRSSRRGEPACGRQVSAIAIREG